MATPLCRVANEGQSRSVSVAARRRRNRFYPTRTLSDDVVPFHYLTWLILGFSLIDNPWWRCSNVAIWLRNHVALSCQLIFSISIADACGQARQRRDRITRHARPSRREFAVLSNTKGVYIVAQTPFDERGEVDLDSVDSLVDFYTEHGADGFTVLGVSGEANKLTPDEAESVAMRYIEQADGRPVIVGVSNASLAQQTRLANFVMDNGAAGVMIAPPTGIKTDEALFDYFSCVFREMEGIPVVLQDFPFSSQVSMSVPAILSLIEAFPQIQMVKEEDLPCLNKISRLRASAGRRVAILTGNNAMYLPLEMGRGADGPMAGFSHPEMLSQVYRLMSQGDVAAANDVFDIYLPLLRYEAMGFWGVSARKEIMRRRGAIKHATMRMPGPRLSAADLAEIDFLTSRLTARLKQYQ
jgi:4-hydroxy-tetrahydrodipicolinate synthase